MNGVVIRIVMAVALAVALAGRAGAQGLLFHGNEVDIASRSGAVLPTPDDKVSPVERLKVRFSLRVNNINSTGFIFGVKNRTNGDMLNLRLRKIPGQDTVYFSFNREGERELGSIAVAEKELPARKLDVEMTLDRSGDKGHIAIGGREMDISGVGLAGSEFRPQVNFGLTRHIVETASFTVSGLEIERDGVATGIPLNESEGETIHDAQGTVAGRVFNPQWQINESYYWKLLAEFHSEAPSGCSFDPGTRRFYLYSADSIATYDDITQRVTRIPLTETDAGGRTANLAAPATGKQTGMTVPLGTVGEPGKLPVLHGMNLFSPRSGRILAYEVYYNDFTGEIDPATGRWRRLAATEDNKAIHHHAHILCRDDSAVMLFGGYGDRMYSDRLVRFNLHTHRFDTIPLKGDRIDPRFYASMCASASGDTLYLYGGKGNHEGRQDIGVKYYYDCYLIDLSDSTSRRLWTQESPERQRVAARTLLRDGSGKYIYAMTYPEYMPHSSLQLYRISLADGSETAVGDMIPMVSEEIATNVALYMPEGEETMYCVVQEFRKDGASDTRIYSIASPPVSEAELRLYDNGGGGFPWKWIVSALAALVLVAVATVAAIRRRRREKDPDLPSALSLVIPENPSGSDGGEDDGTVDTNDQSPLALKPEKTANVSGEVEVKARMATRPGLPERDRISLFGPFTAIDASGHDMSHLFSPKLRTIFIYLLLGTWRRGGVTASELNAVFWPDKEADKIKNLRNVTIAKLRKILADFNGLAVVYENGRFIVRTAGLHNEPCNPVETGGEPFPVENNREGCYVDIDRLLALTENLCKEPDAEPDRLEMEAIILQGKFMQGIESEELDGFRSDIESFMLDAVMRTLERCSAARQWDDVVKFSHIALRTDPVNETAMRYGMKGYEALGSPIRARKFYEGFVENYRKIYGEDYKSHSAE